jgi:Protein of unknown function (DUF3443)
MKRSPPAGMRTASAVVVLTSLVACGGGSDSGSTQPLPPPSGANVAPVVVEAGPAGTINTAFVTVTICVPASTNCQTIDHVLIDTGSSGLRLIAAQMGAVTLPGVVDMSGNAVAECQQFADGYTWGTVNLADVTIAGEKATNLPVHIILPPSATPAVPAECSSGGGPPEYSTQTLGANGILGISVFREDCGPNCANNAVPQAYYSCPATGCVATPLAQAQQVQNPVWKFTTDNNGAILQLPSVGSAGTSAVSGTLTFGIGTQSNNSLGNSIVLPVDTLTGNFTTTFAGQTLPQSFLDAGSNALLFPSSIATCTTLDGFYCPAALQTLTATNHGTSGGTSTVSFNVANAETLTNLNPAFWVYSNLAGPNPLQTGFTWGLPFFLGRSVAVGIEGQSSPAGTGPFVAY